MAYYDNPADYYLEPVVDPATQPPGPDDGIYALSNMAVPSGPRLERGPRQPRRRLEAPDDVASDFSPSPLAGMAGATQVAEARPGRPTDDRPADTGGYVFGGPLAFGTPTADLPPAIPGSRAVPVGNPRRARMESASDSDVNPQSGAGGRYQIMPDTFAGLRANNPDFARRWTAAQLMEPGAQEEAIRLLDRQNAPVLERALGRAPTPQELDLAHRYGAGGATALLTADPNTPVAEAWQGVFTGQGTPALGAVLQQNRLRPDMTAAQVIASVTGQRQQVQRPSPLSQMADPVNERINSLLTQAEKSSARANEEARRPDAWRMLQELGLTMAARGAQPGATFGGSLAQGGLAALAGADQRRNAALARAQAGDRTALSGLSAMATQQANQQYRNAVLSQRGQIADTRTGIQQQNANTRVDELQRRTEQGDRRLDQNDQRIGQGDRRLDQRDTAREQQAAQFGARQELQRSIAGETAAARETRMIEAAIASQRNAWNQNIATMNQPITPEKEAEWRRNATEMTRQLLGEARASRQPAEGPAAATAQPTAPAAPVAPTPAPQAPVTQWRRNPTTGALERVPAGQP